MKALLINGSHRKSGNTTVFLNLFRQKLLENKIEVETLILSELNIEFCNGCLSCEESGKCVISDVFTNKIIELLKTCDFFVFASPSYFNMVTAKMKNFIDRTNPLCTFFETKNNRYINFIVGQSDIDSCTEVSNYLDSFASIMNMTKIHDSIMRVARDVGELTLDENLYDTMNTIIKKLR